MAKKMSLTRARGIPFKAYFVLSDAEARGVELASGGLDDPVEFFRGWIEALVVKAIDSSFAPRGEEDLARERDEVAAKKEEARAKREARLLEQLEKVRKS